MNEKLKIGDPVIIEDGSIAIPKNAVTGGYIVMIADTYVFVRRGSAMITKYSMDQVRKLRSEDIGKTGIDLI